MAENPPRREPPPTQPTQPRGKHKDRTPYEPVEIPVPKVSTVRAALRSVAQPVKKLDADD